MNVKRKKLTDLKGEFKNKKLKLNKKLIKTYKIKLIVFYHHNKD